jgi:transposase
VLTLPRSVRIFASPGVTDMRKSFDTLAELARRVIGEDPLSGHLFVFCNRSRNRLKILYWERGGFWLLARRLEQGTFAWPGAKEGRMEMSADDLLLLLGGLDPSRFARRAWYQERA